MTLNAETRRHGNSTGWRRTRAVRLARSSLQLVITVVAGLLTVFALLPAAGHEVMVVTSGSMAPMFTAGDAVVLSKTTPRDVAIGDVITFQGYGTRALTTHRVVGQRLVGGRLHFQTKGDANTTVDPNLAPAHGLQGRVVAVLPNAGRGMLLLRDPWVRLGLLGGPSLLTLAGLARQTAVSARAQGESTKAHPWSRRLLRSGVAACLLLSAVSAGVIVTTQLTAATLADQQPVGDNTFTTKTLL